MVAPVWVLYRQESGDFAEATALMRDGDQHLLASDGDFLKQTTDRICTEPFAFDHDGDGDLDLIIGNFSGAFLLATNEGSKTEPKFSGKPMIMKTADGQPLQLQNNNHGAPYVVDWDGDGDMDILSGTGRGGIQIAENNPGEDGAHAFSQFKPLIEFAGTSAGMVAPGAPITKGNSWRICVTDFNGDGKLDILVGDCLRRSVAKEGLSIEEAQEKQKTWNEAFTKLRMEMSTLQREMATLMSRKPQPAPEDADGDGEGGAEKTAPEEKADEEGAAEEEAPDPMEAWNQEREALTKKMQAHQKAYGEHYKKRAEFMTSEATGHVWVYLRK